MSTREKVAYLKGLIEGSEYLGGDAKNRAIWDAMLAVLSEVAEDMDNLAIGQAELEDYVGAMDDDLSYLENEVYGDDEDEEDDSVEIECPECGEVVCFAEDLLYEDNIEVTCFNCGAVVYSSDEDEEDDLDLEFEE